MSRFLIPLFNWLNCRTYPHIITEEKVIKQYSGPLLKVPKPDPAADALAKRIGGQSCMRFANNPKEFDVITDTLLAETKPALKHINSAFRKQAKQVFEAAQETCRSVYYHFEGELGQEVIAKLEVYAERYNVKLTIDTKPLK